MRINMRSACTIFRIKYKCDYKFLWPLILWLIPMAFHIHYGINFIAFSFVRFFSYSSTPATVQKNMRFVLQWAKTKRKVALHIRFVQCSCESVQNENDHSICITDLDFLLYHLHYFLYFFSVRFVFGLEMKKDKIKTNVLFTISLYNHCQTFNPN